MDQGKRPGSPRDLAEAYYAVVRRWDHAVYQIVRNQFPAAQVIWDRRQGERRRAPQPTETEQRKGDRRRSPPSSWRTMGFVVVPGSGRRTPEPPGA